ncbi:IS91 family transposase [bacterium]
MEVFTGKYSIKQIFLHNDNWLNFVNQYAPLIRHDIHFNVEKIFNCKTESLGFHQYICPKCGYTKKVPHTCKSRFCSSCGKIAVDNWVQKSISQFPDIQYRHIVFTLPEQLRPLCALNRKLILNALFKLAANSIISWSKEQKKAIPGIISVIHTFGKSLAFNPHVHLIVSCGALSLDQSTWIPIFIFPEKVLKARWKYNVINFLRSAFKNNQLSLAKPFHVFKSYSAFNSMLNMLYQKYIWYVHIGKKLSSLFFTVQYIGRYTKRPVIAETRISHYNGNSVSFWFDDKHLQKKVFITLSTTDFIKRLIRHIPDKNFKQIRYFGIFANRVKSKLCNIVRNILNKKFIPVANTILSWRQRLTQLNGSDPLACPNCKSIMQFSFALFPIRGAPL